MLILLMESPPMPHFLPDYPMQLKNTEAFERYIIRLLRNDYRGKKHSGNNPSRPTAIPDSRLITKGDQSCRIQTLTIPAASKQK